jgi:hypothetical protein
MKIPSCKGTVWLSSSQWYNKHFFFVKSGYTTDFIETREPLQPISSKHLILRQKKSLTITLQNHAQKAYHLTTPRHKQSNNTSTDEITKYPSSEPNQI